MGEMAISRLYRKGELGIAFLRVVFASCTRGVRKALFWVCVGQDMGRGGLL
jgi:hypothetical protein